MAEHMTPAQQRSELAGIVQIASGLIDLLDLYEDVYADEVSEEISRLLGEIGVRGHLLRRAHVAAHKRDAVFADAVFADLDRLKVVTGADAHEEDDQ